MSVRSTKLYRRAMLRAHVASDAALHAFGVSRPTVLLQLGHMRSGSTLLLHLLLTSPEIAAVGERNAPYTSRAEFARLAIQARLARRRPFGRLRYVVDQINHTHLTPLPALLGDSRVRVLFLLRRPEATLRSLLELSRDYYDSSWSITRAVDYYVTRLEGLANLAASIPTPDRAAFVRYETLTEDPDGTLQGLGAWLGLRHPLSARYELHPFTRSRGDPGLTITAGTIVRRESLAEDGLSCLDLARAVSAYDKCNEALTRFARRED